MAEGIRIEIVSPERLVLSETARSVTVPGSEGYFTVMGDHAPLMTTLRPGFVTVNTAAGTTTFYVRGGFADVSPDGMTILAEQASTFADFDRSEIERLLNESQTRLTAAQSPEERNVTQELVNGWANLLAEAGQLRPNQHIH